MGEVFNKAGIQVNRENKKEIDGAIRQIVGVTEGGCPLVWREVKKAMAENQDAFALKLKDAWKRHQVWKRSKMHVGYWVQERWQPV